MGKKMRKKARSGQKEKKVATSSPKTTSQDQNPSTNEVNAVASAVKEKMQCAHLVEGINLANISSKLGSAEFFTCEDCREGASDRRAHRGKGKQGKKKGSGSLDSKADSRAIWVCLECGHFACGGVGLPTTHQSHAIRHARQNKHPLVIQVENPHLRWCFPCGMLIPAERLEENGDQKDLLSDIVKLVKKQPSKSDSVDVESVWFGSGSIVSETKSEKSILSNDVNRRCFYAVRGLINLGNTCFFNSVMQNLLAMERLRQCLLKLEDSSGPLTSSLKKLYIEMSPDTGLRSAVNPRSLFGCVCAQAPQFRGYQQQDSHELLCCVLDGLANEDLRSRGSNNTSVGNENSSHTSTQSFIDAIFAGKLSSTVCCKACGHTSVVYESFLDLSLPVPTKKPPPKKAQPFSRTRKTKPFPKRPGKTRLEVNSKEGNSLPTQSDSSPSMSIESSCGLLPNVANVVNVVDNDALLSGSCSGSAFQDSRGDKSFQNAPVEKAVYSDDITWMDFLEPISLADEPAVNLWEDEATERGNSQDFGVTDRGQGNAPQQDMAKLSDGLLNHHEKAIVKSDTAVNFWEDEVPVQVGGSEVKAADEAVAVDDFTWMDFLEPVSLSDEQVLASQYDGLSISEDFGVTVRDQTNAPQQDMAACSDGLLNHPEEAIVKSETTANSWEDEVPVYIGETEVLLLPYREETSANVGDTVEGDVGPSSLALSGIGEEGLLDFDGFGDMFNEPDDSGGPCVESLASASGALENGYAPKNSSESDLDEVDNSHSPVSIESCLSLFTKAEDLTREHAWHCENCSKVWLKKRRSSRKRLKSVSTNMNASDSKCSHDEVVMTNGRNGDGGSNQASKKLDLGKEGADNSSEGSGAVVTSVEAGVSNNASVDSPEQSTQLADDRGMREVSELVDGFESGKSDEEVTDSKSVKVMRDATKRMMISKLPPILTIHLKRFSQDARFRLSKLNGHIVFKEVIDLGPFMDPRSKERARGGEGEYKYRLIGVVEHIGSMRGGHYIAYVRGGDRRKGGEKEGSGQPGCVWYYASDAHVRETSLEDVLRCEAYIMFYEKL